MDRRSRLRRLLDRDDIAYLPGVHDAMSATLAGRHDRVDAIQHSGYGTAASLLGLPDMDFLSLTETLSVVRNVVNAAGETPVVVDGDTGYGGVANLRRTVSEVERTGAAGMFIEDQATPKQCGLMADKDLVSAERMAGKVSAAAEARDDDDFVLVARTDAYARHGVDEVVARGHRYDEAGADAFLLGEVLPLDDLERVCDRVDLPVYALTAKTTNGPPRRPLTAYDDAGAAMVSDVAGMLQVAVRQMDAYLDAVSESGDLGATDGMPLDDLSNVLGAEAFEAFAARHGGN